MAAVGAPLIRQPSPPLIVPIAQEDVLEAELNAMGQEIQRHQGRDEIAENLRLWHRRFSEAIHLNVDRAEVLRAYTELLQEILICPLTRAPLNAMARLGNDGHTYSHQGLTLFLLLSPEGLRRSSPLHPDNPDPFFTERYPLVEHMVGWLERRNALLHNENIDALQRQLVEEHGQPEIPTRLGLALQARRARALEREQQPAGWRNALALADQALTGAMTRIFDRIDERILGMIARIDARFARLADLDTELLQQMRDRLDQCQENLENLRREGEALDTTVRNNDQSIGKVDEDTKKLETGINEVKQALEERKMKWWEIALIVVVVAAIVILTAASCGTAAAGTGPSIGIVIPF